MREILFRAKREDNGEWAYGYYVRLPDAAGSASMIHTPARNPDESNSSHFIRSSTIGQFTGLTDKNGTKIFEGDIVEYEGKRYSINYLPHYARFSAVKPNTVFCVFAYQRGEVIGNIYDNPELIGGGENGDFIADRR